jgi:hypothetical protein
MKDLPRRRKTVTSFLSEKFTDELGKNGGGGWGGATSRLLDSYLKTT